MLADNEKYVQLVIAYSYAKGWLESIEGDELFIEHNKTEYNFYKTTATILGELIEIGELLNGRTL